MTDTKLLKRLPVLDLTTNVPGPFCSMILSDLGAKVIKIEPPGGDPLRHSPGMFESLNRGKQSIELDLKTSEGHSTLSKLVSKSDIIIEGSRPGVSKRLKADYDTLSSYNPRLVYCSISGFGQDGPWKSRPGHDIDYLSKSGYIDVQSMTGSIPNAPPILVSDLASGLYATIAILSGIVSLKDSGVGTYLDLSMTDSALSLLGLEIGRIGTDDSDRSPNVTYIPHYGVFQCADGEWVSLGIVHENHFWKNFCQSADISHVSDLIFEDRLKKAEYIRELLVTVFQSKSAKEWETLLIEADVPAARVTKLSEVFDSPHFKDRGSFVELGINKYLSQPFKVSSSIVAPIAIAPKLDQHRSSILSELVNIS